MGSQTIYKALLVIIFIAYVHTAKVSIIDDFVPDVSQLRTARPGNVASQSSNGTQTLGTERDAVISNYIGSDPSSSTISITGGEFSCAFGQGVSGYALTQYDGFDNSSNVNLGTLGPIDLTADNSAYAFFLTISTDIPANFTIRVYSPAGAISEAFISYTPLIPDQEADFYVPFSTFTGGVLFTAVSAIELILNVTTPTDIAVSQFGLFGYEASGLVFFDCNQNGVFDSNERAFPNAVATLFSSSNVALATTTTDLSGFFEFLGLANGTYRVCITQSGSATPTFPSNGCRAASLINGNDATNLFFGYTIATRIIPPENVTIQCGACNTTNCTGTATGVGCSSAPTITSSDSTTGTCPRIITRTFSAAGAPSVKQTITVVDTFAPDLTKAAQDQVVPCDNQVPSIATWVSTHGGATATDCTATIWTSNYTGTPALLGACTSLPVTFTVSDACNNQTKTTASYITTDSKAPTISPKASNKQVQCDINGNTDIAAFNAWISSHGGADATDNCAVKSSLSWTNDNGIFVISQSCNVTRPVVFTVQDTCGNPNSTAAVFNNIDTTKPTVTKQAVSRTVNCSADINTEFNEFIRTHGTATATDNCCAPGLLNWTPNNTVTPTGCSSVTPITFTITDPCGNNITTSASFIVTASNGPVITKAPSPLSVNCSDSGSSAAINNWLESNGGATASDLCTGTDLNWSNNFNSLSPGNGCKNISVTFTACNKCNPAKCTNTSSTLSLIDQFSPVFVILPQNISKECGTSTPTDFTNWLQFYGNGQVSDDCTPPQNIKVTNNWPVGQPLSNGCNNQANVTFVATDACGNPSPGQLATYRISDTIPPSISSAEDFEIECSSKVTNNNTFNNNAYQAWITSHGGASGSDACSTVKWTNNGTATVPSTCFFSEFVQFNATDSCGLVNTTYATFTLSDTLPPVISKDASDLNTTCTSDFNSTLTNWLNTHGGAIATDNCTNIHWDHDFESLGGGCSKSALVVFTVSDECSHSDTTAATFSVLDTQAPNITVPASSQSVACDFSAGSAFITFLGNHGGAVAKDACQPDSELVWTYNIATIPTTCGSVKITFNVTDGCGAYAYTTATFTVTDQSPPVIFPRASDLDVECDGNGNTLDYSSWVASRGGAFARDTCSLNVTWTNNAPAKGPVGCGSQLVTYTVADGCGNKAATTATYTVYDDIPPSIFPIAEDIIVECDGKGNQANLTAWLNAHAGAKAVDICYGTTSLDWKYTLTGKFTSLCTNYTTYTFYVSDNCGNTATTTANFGITDSFPPTITVPPSPLRLECGASNEADIDEWLATHGGAEASDSCTTTSWANDYVDEDFIGCYTRPVIFVAYDACLNVAFSQTTLTIYDSVNPEFVDFPADVTLPCDADTDVKYTGYPRVQDACSVNSTDFLLDYHYTDTETNVPASPSTPQCPGDIIITRTFTVTDICGNTAKQNQTITIKIQRSSGSCTNNCTCNQECCPIPDPQDCLSSNCLPQTCAPSFCAAVLCSCPTTTRAIGSGDIFADMPNDPHPVPLDGSIHQCEPVYIFVNDDDNEPNGHDHHHDDHSVAVPQPSHFTNRVPTDSDKKEYRKTQPKKGRSILQNLLSFFF